jgi:hypothetical protein
VTKIRKSGDDPPASARHNDLDDTLFDHQHRPPSLESVRSRHECFRCVP